MKLITADGKAALRNPLDLMEEIVSANEWLFDRASNEELAIEVQGRWSDYRIFAVWQHELGALQFSCQLELKVPQQRRAEVCELVSELNGRLWLGHFDLGPDMVMPTFRHTLLLRGGSGASSEQLADLVEFAIAECERFYPAFQFVIWGGKSASEAVASSILDTVGVA
jgi:hypothetical protein